MGEIIFKPVNTKPVAKFVLRTIMKKIFLYLHSFILVMALCACGSGFSQDRADSILQKQELTEEDYDNLLLLYESAIDDAIRFSTMKPEDMSEKNRKEVITMFAIGKRLTIEEEQLTESQRNELARINQKGKDELKK